MTATAATSPGTMADDATVGTVAWSNPDNAKVSDDVYATATAPSNWPSTHYLVATNFGFSIPTGATINGILVEVEGKTIFQAYNMLGRIIKGGTIVGGGKGSGNFTSSDTYVSLPTSGASTDLWGQSWTYSDINNSGFGVALYTSLGTTGDVCSVDHIRITVYYTEATGTNMQVNVGDVMKDVAAIQVNVGDVWKEVTAASVNVGDVWKSIF